MLHRRARQQSHSRDRSRVPQTHLREPVVQSSHGRPVRSPIEVVCHLIPLERSKTSFEPVSGSFGS